MNHIDMRFWWVLITGLITNGCDATATFQIDLFGGGAGGQKRSLPLSSVIDYRLTNVDTVKNVNFVYYSR